MASQGGAQALVQSELSLGEALAACRDPLLQLREAVMGAEAPSRLGRKQAPFTFADALTQVTAREEAKRKALASRKEIKKSSKLRPGVTPPHDAFRGAVQGGGSEPSAFWMVMEDYFRDVTREDLLELLPAYPDSSSDPAFLVPPLGRPHDAPPLEAGGFGAAPDAAGGRSQLEGGPNGIDSSGQTPGPHIPSSLLDFEEMGSGRRSSRLTARTARAAEEMRLQETPAAEAAEAAAAADAFGGPPGGCLLDACSSAELALIASQVLELRAAVLDRHTALDASSAVSQAASAVFVTPEGEVSFPELSAEERAPLREWLGQQGEAMLRHLLPPLPVTEPGAGSAPAAAADDGGASQASADGQAADVRGPGNDAIVVRATGADCDARLKVDWDEMMRAPPPAPEPPPALAALPAIPSAAAASSPAAGLMPLPAPGQPAPQVAAQAEAPPAPVPPATGSAPPLHQQHAVPATPAPAQPETVPAPASAALPDAAAAPSPAQPPANGQPAAGQQAPEQPGAEPMETDEAAVKPQTQSAVIDADATAAAQQAGTGVVAADPATRDAAQQAAVDPGAAAAAATEQADAQQPAGEPSGAQQPAGEQPSAPVLQPADGGPAPAPAQPEALAAAAEAAPGGAPAAMAPDAAPPSAAPQAPKVGAALDAAPAASAPAAEETADSAGTRASAGQQPQPPQPGSSQPADASQQPVLQLGPQPQQAAPAADAVLAQPPTPAWEPPATPALALLAQPAPVQSPAPPPPPPSGPVTWDDWCEALRRQPPLARAPNQVTHLYTRMVLQQPVAAPAAAAPAAAAAAPAAVTSTPAALQGQPQTCAGAQPASAPQLRLPDAAAGHAAAISKPSASVPLPNGFWAAPGTPGGLQLIPENGLPTSSSGPPASGDAAGEPAVSGAAAGGGGTAGADAKADPLAAAAALLPPVDPRLAAGDHGEAAMRQYSDSLQAAADTAAASQQPPAGLPLPPPQPQQQQPQPQQQQPPSAAVGAQMRTSGLPLTDAEIAAASGRGAGARRPGGGSLNYSLLAGGKRQSVGGSRRPGSGAVSERTTPHPVALANAVVVAAGKAEASLQERWADLGDAADLVAAAPDDEILGEILALQASQMLGNSSIPIAGQAELAAVAIANRAAIIPLIPNVLAELPAQLEAAAHRDACAAFVRDYHMSQREVKRFVKREKREQQHREQIAAAEANAFQFPRSAAGRQRGAFVDRPRSAAAAPGAGKDPLIDALAERGEEEEALCAVCGGGASEAPNMIVFCERCDVAVHQDCYAVRDIPSGEWLCWPCKRYEEQQLALGKAQAEVRPPRWESAAADAAGSPSSTPRAKPPGGSRECACAACPIRLGAFKQTADGSQWVHVVCALWQPALQLADEPRCEVVSGRLPAEAYTQPCSVCRHQDGATVKCGGKNCTTHFHPLCARNAGGYLTTRDVGGRIVHRGFCPVHAEAARRRDRSAQEALLASLGYSDFAVQAALPGGGDVAKRRPAATGAAAERRAKGAAALAAREREWEAVHLARLELEEVRLMLDRVRKREKLKRNLANVQFQLTQSYLADPLAAAVALGLDIGAASEPPADAAAEPAPDGAAAAPNSTAAGATAAPAAAPEAAAAAAAAGAGRSVAEQPDGVPPPGVAPAASAKRKRDRSGGGKSRSGTGKRSKRQAPRELASLQDDGALDWAHAGAAPDALPGAAQASPYVGPALRASSLSGHHGPEGAAAAAAGSLEAPLAAPAAAKQPRSRGASATPRAGAGSASAATPPATPRTAAARRAAAGHEGAAGAANAGGADGGGGVGASAPAAVGPRGGKPRDRSREKSRAKPKAATAPRSGGVAKPGGGKSKAAAPKAARRKR